MSLQASRRAVCLVALLSMTATAAKAQSGPSPPARAFELPAFIGAHSLKELEEAKSAREGGGSAKADATKQLADDAEARRRAEDARRAAAEAEVKRKAEEVRRLAQQEAEARKRLHDEKRLLEQENAAKRRADERFRELVASPPPGEGAKSQPAVSGVMPEMPANAAPEPEPPVAVQNPAAAAVAATVAPAQVLGSGVCAPADVTAEALRGGRMRITMTSPCRAGQAATVTYGRYRLGTLFDGSGNASLDLDLFLGKTHPVAVLLQDGSRREVVIVAKDLERVTKIAVTWQAPVNLDLHAYEYTAKFDDAGHVWAGASPSPEAVIEKVERSGRGQGFVSAVANAATQGDRVEVYTFWHAAGEQHGVVTMALDYETRGDTPGGETCGDGRLAGIDVTVWRLARGAAPVSERRVLAPVACGAALAREVRFNPDSMPHLTVR